MKSPIFLTLAEVINIHTNQIERYGGQNGARDFGLLQSALAQLEALFVAWGYILRRNKRPVFFVPIYFGICFVDV